MFPLFSHEKCLIEPNLKISLILLSSGETRKEQVNDENECKVMSPAAEVVDEADYNTIHIDDDDDDADEKHEIKCNSLTKSNGDSLDGKFNISSITPKKLVVDLKRMKIPRDSLSTEQKEIPSDNENILTPSIGNNVTDSEFKKPEFDRISSNDGLKYPLSMTSSNLSIDATSLSHSHSSDTLRTPKIEKIDSGDEIILKRFKIGSEPDMTHMSDDSEDDDYRTVTEEITDVIIKPANIKLETDLKCEEIIKDKSHDDTENEEPEDGLPRGRRLFKCLQCEKIYRKKKSLMCHSHQHHPGWCPLCGQYYGCTPPEMAEHNREFHIKDHPYICAECGECFKRNQQFQVHLEVHIKRKKKAMESMKISSDIDEDKKKTYKCEICTTEFKGLKCYEKHCQDSHKLEGYICEHCGGHFKDKYSLQQHNFKVHKKEIACPHCPKKFSYKSNLDRHILLHTEHKKSYICEQCGAAYFTPMALKEHYSYAHKKVKDFKCDLCDKAFSAKRALQRHQVVHSDDRPFKCSLCSRTFKIKSNLVRHNQLTHKHPALDGKIKRFIKDENGEFVEALDDDDIEPESPVPPKPIKRRRRKPNVAASQLPPPVIDGNNFMDMMNTEMQQYPIQTQQNMGMMQMNSNLNQNYGTYNNDQLETSINNILNQSQFQNDYTTSNYNMQPDCNWSNVPAQNNMSSYSLVDVNSESLMSLQLKSDPNQRNDGGQIMDIPNADLIHYQDLWHPSHMHYSNNIEQNSPNNTYSNIGSILTNLEMMDNQTNSMPDPNMPMSSCAGGVSSGNIYHHETDMNRAQAHTQSQHVPHTSQNQHQSHQQHQQMDQSHLNYDFNSQNHTITDISNTFIKDISSAHGTATQSSSSSNTSQLTAVDSSVPSISSQQHKRDNSNMNDVMETIDLNQKQIKEMLQNTNENVTLPSLIDYLQHPYQF